MTYRDKLPTLQHITEVIASLVKFKIPENEVLFKQIPGIAVFRAVALVWRKPMHVLEVFPVTHDLWLFPFEAVGASQLEDVSQSLVRWREVYSCLIPLVDLAAALVDPFLHQTLCATVQEKCSSLRTVVFDAALMVRRACYGEESLQVHGLGEVGDLLETLNVVKVCQIRAMIRLEQLDADPGLGGNYTG